MAEQVVAQKVLIVEASEPETGKVAVANRDAAARGQKAVDGCHQAAEQGAGGQEADRCSFGHVLSPFRGRGVAPLRDLLTIYVCQIPATTGLFA